MDDEINQDSLRPLRETLMGIVGEAPPFEGRDDPDALETGHADALPSSEGAVGLSASVEVIEDVAVAFDPEVEDRYWAETYNAHPYSYGLDYKAFQPACRYGWESFVEYRGRSFDEVEEELKAGWEQHRGDSGPEWNRARAAARAAWNRMERASRKGRAHDSGEIKKPK
jgi:hypothetical protein